MKKYLANQQGMTLVELMVALTIFAVGLLAIAGMQFTSIRANLRSNTRSTAIVAGQGVLEDLAARVDTDAVFDLPGPNTGTISVPSADGNSYNVNYTVTLNTPISDIAKIDVDVVSIWNGQTQYSLTNYKRVE